MIKYYVRLIENNRLSSSMKEQIIKLELDTYEEKFPFESEAVEVYKIGTFNECSQFVNNIKDEELRKQFEVVKR